MTSFLPGTPRFREADSLKFLKFLKQCLEVIESHVALSNGLFNFGIHKVLLTVFFLDVSKFLLSNNFGDKSGNCRCT